MKDLLVNEQIRSATVIVISSQGEKKGQFTRIAALNMARAEGMDLIQVAPGTPPVCKIADYGKIKYQQSKSEKKGHSVQTKEIRFHIDTGQHDVDVKMRKVVEFLKRGDKVRVVIRLEGREKAAGGPFRAAAKDRLAQWLNATVQFSPNEIKEGGNEIFVMLEPSRLKG